MNLNHSPTIQVPSLIEIRDPAVRNALDATLRLMQNTFRNIFDDLVLLTEDKRHTVESGTTLTLTDGGVYVFTGSSGTTWTLPELSRENDIAYFIKNRGSATITLQRAGSDELYNTAAVTSISITAGQAALITNDGTYWIVHYHA